MNQETIEHLKQRADKGVFIAPDKGSIMLVDYAVMLEKQLKEARDLVRGLVECVGFYARGSTVRASDPYCSVWEGLNPITGAVFHGDRARQCLKDNAEAIEKLTKEEK